MDVCTQLYLKWINKELCSVLSASLDGRGAWGRMDTCVCTAGSLCSPPDTITTLSIR